MLPQENRQRERAVEEEIGMANPVFLQQVAQMLASFDGECTGFPGPGDGLASLGRRGYECKRTGRPTGALDIAHHNIPAVAPDIEPENKTCTARGALDDLDARFVWTRRCGVRSPLALRRLGHFNDPAADRGESRAESNAGGERTFAPKAN